MEKSKKTASADELLRRIQELEERHNLLEQQISKLRRLSDNQPKPSPSSACPNQSRQLAIGGVVVEPYFAMKLNENQYLNILESMGQSVFIYDVYHRIIFWNRGAESIYGYTAGEVMGRTPTELLAEPKDAAFSDFILKRTVNGESWFGEFPIKNKAGENFVVICANTPYRDEHRRLIGAMCLSSDSRPYQVMKVGELSVSVPQQPLQTSIISKISNLALKVKSKMKTGENYRNFDVAASDNSDDSLQSEGSTPRGHIAPSPFGVFFSMDTLEESYSRKPVINPVVESENKPGIRKQVLSPKQEDWMGKKGMVIPWKANERNDQPVDAKLGHVGWHRNNVHQGHEPGPQSSSSKLDCQLCVSNGNKIEASGLWLSSIHVSSTSSTSSGRCIKDVNDIKVNGKTDSLDYEIQWEELITKKQIGQGSCGTVYHGLWYGSDVAVKLFAYQEFSDSVIVSFKMEVSLMKRLRHPNILLFMGAVTSPQRLCIVTEFLPRGSLFQILNRNTTQLDWRRRLHMAMDIARGMNYLHNHTPPIVHRDLKSSNLLVDRNWTVKVGDFGLSRLKYETYLKTKSGKGTPQWMAPEVMRGEDANERSDVYSFGVVLWEIITGKVPWDDLNPIQVIAAVGFMNKRLEIPKDVDPLWASLIECCWHSEPQSRPTFQEILCKLKDLQKNYAVERRR
uniref:probable serine/threonine-protein kinase DDB_G0281745 n=1 Tax=Erigeron canadensis TaxID=72917 RepID=UPI001CB95A3C|nr:probable serine/threonine-protein kinase DDB_G0281745 [Erigeron canadensis]